MKRRKLDVPDVAIVCLSAAAIGHLVLPQPWAGIASAAAAATLVTVVLAWWVWPKQAPPHEPETGSTRAGVVEILDGYRAAGFGEDEAKELVRSMIRAEVSDRLRASAENEE